MSNLMLPEKTTYLLPAGTMIHRDGNPRLTYGGFVGSAKVDPAYAVKVKGQNFCVDFRDFLEPSMSPRNMHRHLATTTLRMCRREQYIRRMARSANIPITYEIIIPCNGGNGFIKALVTRVRKHLIGTLSPIFHDVVDKVKTALSVRVSYQAKVDGKDKYTTRVLNPWEYVLKTRAGQVVSQWPIIKDCIEQNDVGVEVPTSTILKYAPDWMVKDLHRYQQRNGALSLYVPMNGLLAWIKRGITAVKRWIPVVTALVPLIKSGAAIIQQGFGADGTVIDAEFYVVRDLGDLVAELQTMRKSNALPASILQSMISPIAQTTISNDATVLNSSIVSRNGYTIDEVEVERYWNFSELAHAKGYGSIRDMLVSRANALNTRWIVYPAIAAGIKQLYTPTMSPEPGFADGEYEEVDYHFQEYPIDPEDLMIDSEDATGIGGKKGNLHLDMLPDNNGETAPEEDEGQETVKFAADYSIGNGIPVKLEWELSPGFIDIGGNKDNVGRYLRFAQFDWARIDLFLTDDRNFRVQCNSAAVSILNFDTQDAGVSSTATLKFVGQGSTVLTAPFPYFVEDNEIKTLLSETITRDVHLGSEIDPMWLVNVVADQTVSEEGSYTNMAALTQPGFDFEPKVLTSVAGDQEVTTYQIDNPNVISTVIFHVEDMFDGLTAQEIRERFAFQGWLDKDVELIPDTEFSEENIHFTLIDKTSGLPVYLGNADDCDFIDSVLVNGAETLELESGANDITLVTTFVTEVAGRQSTTKKDTVTWIFTVVAEPKIQRLEFAYALDTTAKAHIDAAIYEGNLFGSSGLEASDFTLKGYDPSGTAHTITDFDIAAETPYIYTKPYDGTHRAVGLAYVYPCNIKGVAESIVAQSRCRIPVPVHRDANTSNTYSATDYAATGTVNQGVIGGWLDIGTYKFYMTYGPDPQTGTAHQPVELQAYAKKFAFGTSTTDRTDVTVFTAAGTFKVWVMRKGATDYNAGTRNVTVLDKTLEDIEVKLKGFSVISGGEAGDIYEVPYGTVLTVDMLDAAAVCDDGTKVAIFNPFTITNYDCTKAGTQTVTVTYGLTGVEEDDPHVITKTLQVNVLDPVIVNMTIKPKTAQFTPNQELVDSDYIATATTDTGVTMSVPSEALAVTEFDTGGAADQTGVSTVQYPPDGASTSGAVATAGFKYDTGLGGGNTKFYMPALSARFTRPYCWKGDTTADFGLEYASMVTPDGHRTPVPLTDVVVSPVVAAEAGHYEVDVTLRPTNWMPCAISRPVAKLVESEKPEPKKPEPKKTVRRAAKPVEKPVTTEKPVAAEPIKEKPATEKPEEDKSSFWDILK